MAEHSTPSVYVKHYDLPNLDIRQLPLILCEATDAIVHGHVKGQGAQLINGIWTICLMSEYAKNFLVEGNYSLQLREKKITIYETYPIIARRPPTEKVIFKDIPFHVSDDDILEYVSSQPDIKMQTKRVIHARIRNNKRELTPFLSGERFIYVRSDLRRVLPSTISINNHKIRVQHHSQERACSRCRYLGHDAKNTELCDAYWEDPNVITIKSPQNALCNYYLCEVNVYDQKFKSSEHAFQWKFAKYVGRDDLAQDILESTTPERAKSIASRVPPPPSKWYMAQRKGWIYEGDTFCKNKILSGI